MALSSLVDLMQQRVASLVSEVKKVDEALRTINIPEKRADQPIAAKRARMDAVDSQALEVEKSDSSSAPLLSSAIGTVRKSSVDEDRGNSSNGRQRSERSNEDLNKMREETLKKLGTGQDRDRNKRLFGALLAGTLQKFRTEQEQSKQVDVKRKQIDEKIQQRAQQEIAELTHRRDELLRERKQKSRIAKRLERKMKLATQFDSWKARQMAFAEFIPTRCADASHSSASNSHKSSEQPMYNIYFRPRLLNDTTQSLLDAHRRQVEEMVESRRKQLEKEIESLLEQIENGVPQKPPGSTRLVSCIATATSQLRPIESDSDSSDFEDLASDDESLMLGRSVNVRSIAPKRANDREHL